MPNLRDKPFWYETDQASSRPSSPAEYLVDTENSHAVLEFTYRYLAAHSRPPSDDEVRNVTTTSARYKGPRVVRSATLELLLAGLLTVQRA